MTRQHGVQLVWLAAACVLSPVTLGQTTSTVRTWDGAAVEWDVVSADLAGLSVDIAGGTDVIGWDRVRAVEGRMAGEALPYLELAEDAWRATSRLARGDAFGAEPIFERLFERTRGEPGPTPAVIAEGLLRCRLRRDARASAVEAWLDLQSNLSSAPTRTPRWGIRSAALDDRSLLCPSLPPIWYRGPAAEAFARRSDGPGSPGDPTSAVRVLYTAAARAAMGEPIDSASTARAVEAASVRPSGEFIANLVLAQIGGATARGDARQALERERSAPAEPWRRVWATIAIGRSLVAEDEDAARRRGVLELVSVHAADRGVSPYLAGVALADAAIACDDLGDDGAARSLLNELMATAPSHPVWDSPALPDLTDSLPRRAPAR